jgi:hypothetical protein
MKKSDRETWGEGAYRTPAAVCSAEGNRKGNLSEERKFTHATKKTLRKLDENHRGSKNSA